MLDSLTILAQRGADSDLNQWLGEHPAVLGGIFIAIGLAVGGYGAWELYKGVAHDKWGNQMEGGMGNAMAGLRLVAGICCVGFGIYKLVAG